MLKKQDPIWECVNSARAAPSILCLRETSCTSAISFAVLPDEVDEFANELKSSLPSRAILIVKTKVLPFV